MPANSFIATAEAVSAVGAIPRLVDVDPSSQLLTAEGMAAALGPRVRCVIPVHLYGATVDLDPILELAAHAGVHVVEDACQAHGARYRGRRVGTFGALGCFSFYPAKNLGAWGDGGAVADRRSSAGRARRAAAQPRRAPPLQAPCDWRVPRAWTPCRRSCCGASCRAWTPGTGSGAGWPRRCTTRSRPRAAWRPPPGSSCRSVPRAQGDHVHHLFVLRCTRRDALREHLAEWGVASAVHYPTPIHLTGAYAHLGYAPGSLPVCERLAERVCSLPLFPGMSDGELQRVVAAVLSFAEE